MRTKYKAAPQTAPEAEQEEEPGKESEPKSGAKLINALGCYDHAALVGRYQRMATAMSSQNICCGCEVNTRQPALRTNDAHSCLSRKTLEMAFRFGLCEFYAVASMKIRDRDTVLRDSVDLAGEGPQGPLAQGSAVNRDSITTSLDNLDSRFEYAFKQLSADKQEALVRDLADTMQLDLHTVLTADVPHNYRQPFVSAICTAYRHLVLRIVAKQLTCDPGVFLQTLARVVAVSDDSSSPTFDMAGGFRSLLSDSTTSAGVAINWIHTQSLHWDKENRVKFGKQCKPCEIAQGDQDLSRRVIEFIIKNNVEPNKAIVRDASYGKLFADLYPSPDQARSTVWDLSNALTCSAIELFYRKALSNRHRTGTEGLEFDFAKEMFARLEAMPHLFIAYMEILMLEFAHTDPFLPTDERHRIVRMLALPDVKLRIKLPEKSVSDEETVDFNFFSS